MKAIWILLLIVLVGYIWFVALPEAKCAGIAQDRNATYLFSAVRGCEIRTRHMSWLLTPSYLREYQREP